LTGLEDIHINLEGEIRVSCCDTTWKYIDIWQP
jgi:hypothetical protein